MVRQSHVLASCILALLTTGCGAESPTPSPDAAAASPSAEPPKLAEPLSRSECLAAGSLSGLTMPADAVRTETSPIHYWFSAPVTAERTLPGAIAEVTEKLEAAGWKQLADPAPVTNEHGSASYFSKPSSSTKQNVIAQVSIGKSPDSPAGAEINAVVMLVGNLDAREFPVPDGAKFEAESPASVIYNTPLKPLDLHKFYKEKLKDHGWISYRPPNIYEGYEPTADDLDREQYFLNHGIKLELMYLKGDGDTRVIARLGVVKFELPLPTDADLAEFGEDPPYVSFFSRQPAEDLVALYTKHLETDGWKAGEPISKEKADIARGFTSEGRDPLWLGALNHKGGGTFLQLKVDKGE
ncbi:hypothetical protein [Aeoliella sp. SH292]|uniref:hypothetical protein n=1 Tax=Aeoliella sp. SH292 TaxID=3454464 RepID=UPI003F9AB90A